MNEGFRIAGGFEDVTLCDQIIAETLVIVDFAIEDNPDGSVFIGNRLVAAREINDTETPHSDRAIAIGVEAFIVRTAVDHAITHRLHERLTSGRVKGKKSCNSTHRF